MASVKCGVTAQAVIHHYHRSETGITIINVKLRWTCSALNLDTVGVQVERRRDNARLLAQIRLWVPMKRTWPGFGTIFSRLHMKTAIGKKARSHVR